MATAMAAQEEWAPSEEPPPPSVVEEQADTEHHAEAEAGHDESGAATPEVQTLQWELGAWVIDGMQSDAWDKAEEMSEAACENTARRRYWDEVEADTKAIRGVDAKISFYFPDNLQQKWPCDFGGGMNYAYGMFVEVFNGFEADPSELEDITRACNCCWCVFKLFIEMSKLRWLHRAYVALQWCMDMMMRPNVGMYPVIHTWVKAPREERPARSQSLKDLIHRVCTNWINQVREAIPHLYITDPNTRPHMEFQINVCLHMIANPNQDLLKLFPELPRLDFAREWDVKHLTRIMVEMRSAWAEPRFIRRMQLMSSDPANPEVKSGRYGLFKRQFDILQKHGLEAGVPGVQELCRHLAEPCKKDKTLQMLCNEIAAVHGIATVKPSVPVAREEVFAPGRRVWAFYDIYMHTEQWRYRYIKVDEPPTGFPMMGTAASWLTGTVVGRAEDTAEALDGFSKVRVRFDGYFCDSRYLWREGEVKAGKPSEFQTGLHYWARSAVENKEFKIPVSLVRDIGDVPPQPLLSVLNVRPMDYYSNGKHSDYNICNDGYVQDLCHGPCSMREQIPGEYQIVSVFIKETENLDRLDAEHLRSKLHGRNIIGWYLQWPQIQSKSLWGNGSVRKQQFFNFCARAERANIRMGWPHQSHCYEFMAGKIWIPRMSLCREFKVPPSCYMDFADFKRNPGRAARRALEQIANIQKAVWGADPTPSEIFKGVVKFGFSWCGTDVLPFLGPEGLVKAVEAMFAKEGNEQTTIIVQEMLPNVFAECRNLCFYDKLTGKYHKERLWVAQMQKLKDPVEGFSGMASSNVLLPNVVAEKCLNGDVEALKSAESEVDALCDRWLQWACTETPVPLQCTRIDFLVAKGDVPGQARVWTCEVGECGGSLCSVEVHARNTVALNHAIRDDPSGRFPAVLHRPLARNDGMKSH